MNAPAGALETPLRAPPAELGARDGVEAALTSAVAYAFFLFYPWISVAAAGRGVDWSPWIATRLDRAIPFLPAMVWVYLTAYVAAVPGIVLLVRSRGVASLRRAAAAFVGMLLVHYALYLLLPTSAYALMLPDRELARHAWAGLMHGCYRLATPYNAFPSFHVASGWFFVRLSGRVEPRSTKYYGTWFAAMFASTLAIKVHWIADGAAGMLLAEACARWAWPWLEKRRALEADGVPQAARLAACAGLLLVLSAGLWRLGAFAPL